MTAEQKDSLKKVAEAWQVVGSQFVDPTMRNAAGFIISALEEIDDLQADLEWLRKRERVLADGLRQMAALISESKGVAGYQFNGDMATWNELRTGGRFEFLDGFDTALKLLNDSESNAAPGYGADGSMPTSLRKGGEIILP